MAVLSIFTHTLSKCQLLFEVLQRRTFPPNCDRVFTNSVGYVMKLYIISSCLLEIITDTYASTAPAVVPAISECKGFSFFDMVAVAERKPQPVLAVVVDRVGFQSELSRNSFPTVMTSTSPFLFCSWTLRLTTLLLGI